MRPQKLVKSGIIALTQGRQPGDNGWRSECGARGRRLVTAVPGRLGHHACRHYDRRARCSLQLGTAQAARPLRLVHVFQEAWPELRLRDDDSLR